MPHSGSRDKSAPAGDETPLAPNAESRAVSAPIGGGPPLAPQSGTSQCENCGAVVTDAYCAVCGQSRRSPIVSLRAFVSQALNELASLDSRLLRSLGALFFKPGHLTRKYLDGRRVRYTQPVQLYLIAAAAFFLLASYRPLIWIDIIQLSVVGELPGMIVGNEVVRTRLLELPLNPVAYELFAERFVGAVNGFLPVFLVGSVVLFSLVVYGVNNPHDRRYLPHAVFALHWTAFFLLLVAVSRLFPAAWLIEDFSLLPSFVYLIFAQRRVYTQGLFQSLWKALLLMITFLMILALWVQSAIIVGLRAV